MKVLIAGGSGYIGRRLAEGHVADASTGIRNGGVGRLRLGSTLDAEEEVGARKNAFESRLNAAVKSANPAGSAELEQRLRVRVRKGATICPTRQ